MPMGTGGSSVTRRKFTTPSKKSGSSSARRDRTQGHELAAQPHEGLRAGGSGGGSDNIMNRKSKRRSKDEEVRQELKLSASFGSAASNIVSLGTPGRSRRSRGRLRSGEDNIGQPSASVPLLRAKESRESRSVKSGGGGSQHYHQIEPQGNSNGPLKTPTRPSRREDIPKTAPHQKTHRDSDRSATPRQSRKVDQAKYVGVRRAIEGTATSL